MRLGVVEAAEAQAPLEVGAREAAVDMTQLAASLIEEPIFPFAQEEDARALAVLFLEKRCPFFRLCRAVFHGVRRRPDRHDGERLLLRVGEEEVDGQHLLARAFDRLVHEAVHAERPARLRAVDHQVAAAALGEKVGGHADGTAVLVLFAPLGKHLGFLAVLLAQGQERAALERLLIEPEKLQRLLVLLLASRRQELLIERTR